MGACRAQLGQDCLDVALFDGRGVTSPVLESPTPPARGPSGGARLAVGYPVSTLRRAAGGADVRLLSGSLKRSLLCKPAMYSLPPPHRYP